MKTHLLQLTIAVALISVLAACENISNPEPIEVINTEKTATIQGVVYANLDVTNDTTGTMQQDFERAPANTTIKVVLDSRDFVRNPHPAVNYQSLTYETTVDASGNYSIEVPALDRGVNAEIYINNFIANQVQADTSNRSRTFRPSSFPYNVTVVAGMSTFEDIIYTAN